MMASMTTQVLREGFERRGYAYDGLYDWFCHAWASADWLVQHAGFVEDRGAYVQRLRAFRGLQRRVWMGIVEGKTVKQLGISQASADRTVAMTIIDLALKGGWMIVPPTKAQMQLFRSPMKPAA